MTSRKWSKVSLVFQLRDEPPKTPTGEVSGTRLDIAELTGPGGEAADVAAGAEQCVARERLAVAQPVVDFVSPPGQKVQVSCWKLATAKRSSAPSSAEGEPQARRAAAKAAIAGTVD